MLTKFWSIWIRSHCQKNAESQTYWVNTYLGLAVIFLEIENNVSVPFIYSEKLYLAMNFLCICG